MTEKNKKRTPCSYSDEFKQQLIALYHNGKRKCDICREYDIATSLLDKWLKQAENSGSFHEKDNRTPEQQELLKLRKKNKQLEMENYILKQAARILKCRRHTSDEGKCDKSKHPQILCISICVMPTMLALSYQYQGAPIIMKPDKSQRKTASHLTSGKYSGRAGTTMAPVKSR